MLPTERALGISWDTERDEFCFKVKAPDKKPTRRNILSIASTVFEPLGFVSPFIMPAKLVLQNLCRAGNGWDDEVSGPDLSKWQKWLRDLPKLEQVYLPRCNMPTDFGDVVNRQLHHFSDASDCGYGTVSYLRQENSDGRVHCTLVFSKSRVAPLKKITIPRMELTAATMAVKMKKILVNAIEKPIDQVYF